MSKEEVSDYIVSLIKPLAPSVSCTYTTDDKGVLFEVSVPDDQKGLLLGRGGENIKAIRRIVSLVGFQAGMRASIKII